MEIKNIFDLSSKVDSIVNNENTKLKEDILIQEENMNSEAINNNFKIIETNLNNMYEKIRVLEDVMGYARIYVNSEIDAAIIECRGLLNDIENMNDLHFNDVKNYTITNVTLVNNDTAQYIDRDSSPLKTCEIVNNVISLSGTIEEEISIRDISIDSMYQIYENNEEDIVNGKPYRTHYLLDTISKNGVTEAITFGFDKARSINSIKISLSNCVAKSIIYIHEDNTETIDTEAKSGIVPNKIVKAIKILLNSSNYEVRTISQYAPSNSMDDIGSKGIVGIKNVFEQDKIISTTLYKESLLNELRKGVSNNG